MKLYLLKVFKNQLIVILLINYFINSLNIVLYLIILMLHKYIYIINYNN